MKLVELIIKVLKSLFGSDKSIPTVQTVIQSLKDFDTFAELEAWFLLHTELRMPEPNLCDDYSRESRILAETDGYVLSYCLVADGVAYMTQVMEKGVYHIANMVIVTDTESVYYVDLAWNKLIKLCDFVKGGKY